MNHKIGFYSAILTAVVTVITFVIAYLTEPLSGPLCTGSCFSYPYLDIASRFPSDYIWMYSAIVLLVFYVVLMTCIYCYASVERKIFSQIGLSFALMSALILLTDYFVQLSVIQPSLLSSEFDGISLLSQYNPHGIFIALEELGYLLMSIAFLFMAPVFLRGKIEKIVRWVFTGNFIASTAAFVVISILYGINREYRFEIAVISINFLTLMVSSVLLGFIFKHTDGARF